MLRTQNQNRPNQYSSANTKGGTFLDNRQQKQTMALRRPPTRVELKADDIDEYEEVSVMSATGSIVYFLRFLTNFIITFALKYQLMNEKMMAAADNSQQAATMKTPATRQAAKEAKKAKAAERIGINNRGR